MPSTKTLLRYCLILFGSYGFLLWLSWQAPIAKTLASGFHGTVLPMVEKIYSGFTFYSKVPDSSNFYDYKLRFISSEELERQKTEAIQKGLTKLGLSGGTTIELKYHQVFFNPWFFLLALLMVTPLIWKRKILALLIGSLLFGLFAIYKIQLIISHQNSGTPQSDWLNVMVSPGFVGFVVIVIWLLTVFQKSNWQEVLEKSS